MKLHRNDSQRLLRVVLRFARRRGPYKERDLDAVCPVTPRLYGLQWWNAFPRFKPGETSPERRTTFVLVGAALRAWYSALQRMGPGGGLSRHATPLRIPVVGRLPTLQA